MTEKAHPKIREVAAAIANVHPAGPPYPPDFAILRANVPVKVYPPENRSKALKD